MRWFSKSARLPKKRTKHPKSTHFSVPLGGAGIYIYPAWFPYASKGHPGQRKHRGRFVRDGDGLKKKLDYM